MEQCASGMYVDMCMITKYIALKHNNLASYGFCTVAYLNNPNTKDNRFMSIQSLNSLS